MKDIDKIQSMLRAEIPLDVHKMITEVEYYTSEDSFSTQGDCFDEKGEFVRYMTYRDGFGFELQPLLLSWHRRLLAGSDKWNRAKFITCHDDTNEVATWWDEDLR